MLTVDMTWSGKSDPELISHASDVSDARAELVADLAFTASEQYTEQVLNWFDNHRDQPGMITNSDGTVDVWMFTADELAA